MARPKGAGAKWNKVQRIQKFETKYITKIIDNINKALEVQITNLNGDNPNLKTGASNFIINEYKAIFKQYKNAQAKDFDTNKGKKIKGTKDGGNGLISLDYEEDTGTEG